MYKKERERLVLPLNDHRLMNALFPRAKQCSGRIMNIGHAIRQEIVSASIYGALEDYEDLDDFSVPEINRPNVSGKWKSSHL